MKPVKVSDPSQKLKIALMIIALVLAVLWGLKVLYYLEILSTSHTLI